MRLVRLYASWQEARAHVVAIFRGKPLDDLSADDIVAFRSDLPAVLAEIKILPNEDKRRLAAAIKGVVDRLEARAFDLRYQREIGQMMLEFGHQTMQGGVIEGMRQAIVAGARIVISEPELKSHPEAQAPWTSFIPGFYASRPGISESTFTSYKQAFREWEAVIGDKHLSDLRPRDVGRYSEWLSGKENDKGNTGKLNRKTIVRLVGHVKTFTSWAKGVGFVDEDSGDEITVREQTRAEQAADAEGAKRAFTPDELTRIFDSPLFTGCYSRHYRSRSGPNIFRDAAWWIFVAALLTGARLDELNQAPSKLEVLDGIACLDLRHGTKTFSAPRLVPVTPDLTRLGFIEYADRQRRAGLALFAGEGSSDDWSKWANRYIDRILGDDPKVSFHSFRHAFRQTCGAAGIDDYVADKLLGHRNKKDRSEGSGYGRDLSPGEARLVLERIRSPIALDHLRAIRPSKAGGVLARETEEKPHRRGG